MTGFVVLGTDTDAGKTSFSLLFLSAFAKDLAYWKPVETGISDSTRIRQLVPNASVCDTLLKLEEPVAPLLAARRLGITMPRVDEVFLSVPDVPQPLVIETFGSPFSPWDENSLQVELLRRLSLPMVLVGSSSVGAVGRMLGTRFALESRGLQPQALVLIGPRDPFAEEQIAKFSEGTAVFSLTMPEGEWSAERLCEAATSQIDVLAALRSRLLSDVTPKGSLLERDEAFVWHPYTPLQGADAPLPVLAASDEFLTLSDGRRLIDGISSWWTILHGHCHPAIANAVSQASTNLDHVQFAGITHPHAVDVAEQLVGFMPWPHGGRTFFSDNGSTAVEVALKVAYQFWCHRREPGRTLFVSFDHCYHGDTFGAMAISRDPVFFGCFEPLLFEARQVPLDASHLEHVLSQNVGRVAAVVIEPLIQGAGGMQMHSPQLLRQLFEVAKRHQVLFIADEVMTGFGRTGSLFAFEQAGIAPDLVSVAKGLTGGVLPLSATLVAPDVVAAFDTADRTRTLFHGHSFTANPLACAAAVASLRLLRTGEWKTNVQRIESHFSSKLAVLRERSGVKDVRTRGLIAAVELESPGGYLSDRGAILRRTSLDHGVMLRPLGNVLYAMPPLCTSEESLHRITAAMVAAVLAAT